MKILAEIFCMIKEHETAAQYEIEQDRENAQITMKRAEGEVVYTTNLYLSSEKYNKEETTSEPGKLQTHFSATESGMGGYLILSPPILLQSQ